MNSDKNGMTDGFTNRIPTIQESIGQLQPLPSGFYYSEFGYMKQSAPPKQWICKYRGAHA